MAGSMLRSSGLATFGSSFDIYAEGNRISFGTAKIGDNRFGSSTNRFRLQSPEGFAFGLTSSKEVGTALGMQGSEIGRASCGERGGHDGEISGRAEVIKKKKPETEREEKK